MILWPRPGKCVGLSFRGRGSSSFSVKKSSSPSVFGQCFPFDERIPSLPVSRIILTTDLRSGHHGYYPHFHQRSEETCLITWWRMAELEVPVYFSLQIWCSFGHPAAVAFFFRRSFWKVPPAFGVLEQNVWSVTPQWVSLSTEITSDVYCWPLRRCAESPAPVTGGWRSHICSCLIVNDLRIMLCSL